MKIVVNGNETELAPDETLESVVASVATQRRGVAAAVNGEVVPRSMWAGTELADGDRVEVLSAIGGG